MLSTKQLAQKFFSSYFTTIQNIFSQVIICNFGFSLLPSHLFWLHWCEVVLSPVLRDETPAVLIREEEPRQSLGEPRPWTPVTCKDPRYGLEPEPWLNSSNDRGLGVKSGGIRQTSILFWTALAHLQFIPEQPISKGIRSKSEDGGVFFNDIFRGRVIKRVSILILFKGGMGSTAQWPWQRLWRQR